MREDPRHRLTPTGMIKLTFLVIIVSVFIGWGLYKSPVNLEESGLDKKDKLTREVLVDSLGKGDAKLNNSKEILMESGIYQTDPLVTGTPPRVQTLDAEEIMCPQYRLPVLPELPELPPKEVMDTVSKDQLNFILYQHIKAHQERTIEVRKRIYVSYADYLKSCE